MRLHDNVRIGKCGRERLVMSPHDERYRWDVICESVGHIVPRDTEQPSSQHQCGKLVEDEEPACRYLLSNFPGKLCNITSPKFP